MADRARLGIDWGKARIGVAAAGAGTSFAYPVETVAAGDGELARLLAIIEEYEPGVVYVGLPYTLAGTVGLSAEFVLEKVARLAAAAPNTQIRLVDERMSTVTASRGMSSAGRRAKKQRRVIDQAAAVDILQRALDAEARAGAPVGRPAPMEEQ